MNNTNIKNLLDRYSEGLCTEQEIRLIHSWYNKRIKSLDDTPLDLDIEKIGLEIQSKIITPKSKKHINRTTLLISVAATIIVCFGLTFILLNNKKSPNLSKNIAASTETINPGKQQATLTLGNGQKILLNDEINGQILKQSGLTISKNNKGQIIYQVDAENLSANNETNKISTGMGETFQINLPDSTQVWLNSGSTLTYQTHMHLQDSRYVELTGEGYFDVTHNPQRPFIVKTQSQKITVLGTSFNISAYTNDDEVITTLVDGSIKLNYNNIETKLKSSQQSIIRNDNLQITTVDVESFIAWKEGIFLFQDEPLGDIMKKIARWYDVSIEYNGIDKNKLIWGSISRFKNIKDVLEIIELTGAANFNIDGRRIIVNK